MRMRVISNLLVLLLLVAVVGLSVAGQTAAMTASEKPAGCHHHGKPDSAPQPAYQCCQSGHNSAILQASHSPDLQVRGWMKAGVPFSAARESASVNALHIQATGDPPGNLPIRI